MNRRAALKLTLLLAPAVVLSVLLGFGGRALASLQLSLFAPKGDRMEVGQYVFVLPNKDWREPTSEFFRAFCHEFAKNHPFQNRDGSRKVKRPLSPLTEPLTIIITTDREAFAKDALGRTRDKLPFSGGYFYPNTKSITIHAQDGPKDTFPSLSHELVHAIMHYSYDNPQFSGWLAEGIAQWGETTDPTIAWALNHGRLRAALGGLTGRNRPLESILDAQEGAFLGKENRWYYESAYALVCFLLDEHRDGFLAYYDEETATGLIRSSDRLAFHLKQPLAEVEKQWLEWLNGFK